MLFTSVQFLVFFIITAIVFFGLPQKFKVIFLVAASYYFYYCCKAEYLLLLIGLTVFNYYVGLTINKIQQKKTKKLYLVICIIVNLSPLLFYKYLNFFSSSANDVLAAFNILGGLPHVDVILPVGISFFTFIGLGYIIDIYFKFKEPEKNIFRFSAYIAFFPQLLSGPIARSTIQLPQFCNNISFSYTNATNGMKLFLWGCFQKTVVADNITAYVDSIYNNVQMHSGSSMVIASYFFALQLYCDFAGYSNMAIGAARFLGFELIENFNRPYFATSVTEFWKRNHISLTTWLRDYIFYPLMGTGFTKTKIAFCTLVMFLISGLWHGANWTFVIWGLIQGIFLVYDQWTAGLNKKLTKLSKKYNLWNVRQRLKVLVTFNLLSFGVIFFRANSVSDAFVIVKNIFFTPWQAPFIGDITSTTYGIFGILIVLTFEFFQKDLSIVDYINKHGVLWRWGFYYFCLISIILLGALDGASFIYFQF